MTIVSVVVSINFIQVQPLMPMWTLFINISIDLRLYNHSLLNSSLVGYLQQVSSIVISKQLE